MKKITLGIVGGGQLGRMSALAAANLGIETVIYCPEEDSPASHVVKSTVNGDYDDPNALKDFAEKVDVISYEFENIPVQTVEFLETLKPVYPKAPLLEVSQDRVEEKNFLNNIDIPTARWAAPKTPEEALSTLAEWQLALQLGGGITDERVQEGLFYDNAELHPEDFIELTRLASEGEADALGLKNMIGNAAEWVKDLRDDTPQVVGGHFMLDMADFDGDWHALEDQSIWNETYPQTPVSKWWYRDHYYQGLRLVCDPVNIPAE